jgi:hypothetical protein
VADTERLIVRALLRHSARCPIERRTRLDSLDEIAMTTVIRQFAEHERGDEVAASRAELLASVILHAVGEPGWGQLPSRCSTRLPRRASSDRRTGGGWEPRGASRSAA